MKKTIIKIIASMALVLTLIFAALPVSAATTSYDSTKTVSFNVTCSKAGYTFNVYKVATLKSETAPYQIAYKTGIDSIASPLSKGDTAAVLSALDSIETMPVSPVGTFNSSSDTSKTFSNLGQGVYYVRAVNFPAGVKEVKNSVFALPYYENGWNYSIDTINLAAKVVDDVPIITKEITNSTKNNVNFTDVSLDDTVNYDITTTTSGSKSFKLKEYYITDTMGKGLTLLDNTLSVKLVDSENKTLATLAKTDFTMKKVKAAAGQDTVFTVSLNSSVLSGDTFYEAKNVVFSFSAKLNEYAVTTVEGNPNTPKLTYTNKTDVSSDVEGNTVYVYTYKVQGNKVDEDNKPLAGATFALYKTENDAKQNANALAEGTSDSKGVVKFMNSENKEILLQSGTYYIRELSAPDGYNVYTSVIPVTIKAEYNDEFVNNTYVKSAPENGTAVISVKNTKTVLPQTGGIGSSLIYIISGLFLTASLITLAVRKKSAD